MVTPGSDSYRDLLLASSGSESCREHTVNISSRWPMTPLDVSSSPSTMLSVLHVSDDLVVIAKPSGLLVHRGWANDDDVLVDRVRAEFGRSCVPAHRLDRGTSGVVLFARTTVMARALGIAFEHGAIEKTYVALVRGAPPASAVVDRELPRTEDGPRVPARTRIECLETISIEDSPLRETRYSLVVAHPETGRLHQVRRHLKSLGHPVIGDANYGRSEHNRFLNARANLDRLALHALGVTMAYPQSGVRCSWQAPLTEDLRGPCQALGFDTDSAMVRALHSDRIATVCRERTPSQWAP